MSASEGSLAADDIRAAMSDLAANFASHTELEPILQTVTEQAVRLIAEVDFADILLIDGDEHRSMAPTAPITVKLDTIQVSLKQGPCLEAITHEPLVHSADLTRETRWPDFAAAAVDQGVRSMMSFHLYTYPDKTKGAITGSAALNLFSRNVGQLSLADQAIGGMLATHAATALIAANRQLQFASALHSRDLLGQAKGILMERFKVDAVRAFNLMTKLSQDTNTPVRVIAQRIVDNP
ncbi:MAG: GAF and ANTAR domain-containing protein [Mycobacterium sp.]